ncbi:TIGR03619 family F420-dependent LLM class oxidoreductase [Patulibacter sp. NPDC049589]|uniref:TIGR03619 family F420-dependent LLM class oxidoreductase n=1 Tax=Patulibacter sp. NPDC049589 TaxID=3154731 RepID=UPI0034176195
MVNIGIFQVVADRTADPAIVAKRVEELGFHSYWLGDHTIYPVVNEDLYPRLEEVEEPSYLPYIGDPLMALARAGAVTDRIKLGTAICLVAERNPILLAKQVATLDDHTGGRVLLGVGGGWNRAQCEILGGDFDRRWAHVRDHVHAMKALWTDDPSSYEGRYASFPPVRCFPKPVSSPHPPILLGSNGTSTSFKRVAGWGDGWMPHSIESAESYADGVATIRELAGEAGRDVDALQFSVVATEGQYRTADEILALGAAGADRVNIWLLEADLDGILRELDELAVVQRDVTAATRA